MRMLWLDLFRGIAAIVVVLFHFHARIGLPQLQFGYLAVDMFFVLSGIVLGPKYAAAIRDGMSLKEFAWHRYRRLYPMAVIAALPVLAMKIAGLQAEHPNWASVWPAISLLFVLPLPPSFGFEFSFPANLAAWSLFAELASNAVWFAALQFRRGVWVFTCIAAFAGFLLAAYIHHDFDIGSRAPYGEVLAGIARAIGWFGLGTWIGKRRPKLPLPAWLLCAILAACLTASQYGWINGMKSDLLIVVVAAALLANLMHVRPPNAWMSKLCTWMGMFSYPLYMTHLTTSRLGAWLAHEGLAAPLAYLGTAGVIGILVTVLNEYIVTRLPRSLQTQAPQSDDKTRRPASTS